MDELMDILADPADPTQGLKPLDADTLQRINEQITKGLLSDGRGPLTTPITAGLINDKGTRVYPVEHDIPILLLDRGIKLEKND